MPRSPPQISQRLAWYQTRTSAVRGQWWLPRLTESLSRWKQLESSLNSRLEPHSKHSNSITPTNHLMLRREFFQGAHQRKKCSWLSEFRTCVDSCNLQAVLRQVHSLFKSEFSTEGDLVLPLLIYKAVFFSLRSPSSFLRLLLRLFLTSTLPSMLPSTTWLKRQFLHKMGTTQFRHKIRQAFSSSYKVPERVMRMKIFATFDKAKPKTENVRGLTYILLLQN